MEEIRIRIFKSLKEEYFVFYQEIPFQRVVSVNLNKTNLKEKRE